ncbi:MAG: membrane associated rhomboid family serine protease [Akkermansiaceae bacterium]|jgi:membrane associated rhomboid family serine protease
MTFLSEDKKGGPGWVMLQNPGLNIATFGVLIMVAVHLSTYSIFRLEGQAGVNSFYLTGGLSWEGIKEGRIWALFTHNWLHGNWSHLFLNGILFYYASARLSHVLSSWRILTLFLICGMGAGLVHVVAQAIFPGLPSLPLVGASGGIFGMLLGFFALSPDSRMLLIPASARNLAKGILISSSFLFIVTPGLNLPLMADLGRWLEGAFGPKLFQMAHLAHFVGGLLGWALILKFFPRLLTREDLEKMRLERELPRGE